MKVIKKGRRIAEVSTTKGTASLKNFLRQIYETKNYFIKIAFNISLKDRS